MELAVLFAFLASLGFASGSIFVRIATQRVSPTTATFFGVLAGALLIQTLALSIDLSEYNDLEASDFGWFVLMGTLGYLVARVLNYSAISMVGASRAAPMGSIQPIFAFALGIIVLSERPNLLVGLGTFGVVGGLVLVIKGGAATTAPTIKHGGIFLGYLMAAGAAATFAVRDTISRHVVTDAAPPLVTAAFALTFGGVLLLVVTHRDVIRSLRNLPTKYIGLCCMAGLLQGLAVTSLFQALSRAPVTTVAPINASAPLATLILAHIFLQRLERVNPMLVVGTVFSVGGVVTVVLGASF